MVGEINILAIFRFRILYSTPIELLLLSIIIKYLLNHDMCGNIY